MYELDEKDMAILRELKGNARASFRKIARKLNIATTTVINKYNRLAKEGVIKKATIEIDYEKMGYTLTALIDIRVSRGRLVEVEEKIAKRQNVYAVYDVTGDFEAEILARFRNRKELNDFIKSLLAMEYVARTNTHLVLNVVKEEL